VEHVHALLKLELSIPLSKTEASLSGQYETDLRKLVTHEELTILGGQNGVLSIDVVEGKCK
jgi:hypothetical protein